MNRFPVRLSLAVLAVGLVALLAVGCGSSDDSEPGAKKMSFGLTDAGCDPHNAKTPAGPINFEVENTGSASVTELEVLDGDTILGEVENLSEGLSGSFSLTLEQGEYTLRCNGGSEEDGTLTVTGGASATTSPEVEDAVLVGVNRFESGERSPLVEGADGGILTVDPALEAQQRDAVVAWRASRDQAAVDAALPTSPRQPRRREHHGGDARRRPRGRDHRRVGRDAARGVRRVPRARPASARPPRAPRPRTSRRCARRSSGSATRSGGGRRSSSASPASTGIPTAPSRSRSAPATSAWTSSTRASA